MAPLRPSVSFKQTTAKPVRLWTVCNIFEPITVCLLSAHKPPGRYQCELPVSKAP